MTARSAQFDAEIGPDAPQDFAKWSGDWNPLHTDAAFARESVYGRPVLHGAFAAGLVSRMAGMHLPGTECLLRGMKLRFLEPILPPASVRVQGQVLHESSEGGSVAVVITDRASGRRLVEAGYDFGYQRRPGGAATAAPAGAIPLATGNDPVLVAGSSGALGRALLAALGPRGLAGSRRGRDGAVPLGDADALAGGLGARRLGAIVQCGWPTPDNTRLTEIADPATAVAHHVGEPLAQCLTLARALKEHGREGATLILIGSTAAAPGRHAYRKPLYSIAKSMIPSLAAALAVELGGSGQRCVAVVFDALDGGMNAGMSPSARVAHADRSPFGLVPTMDDAARQILWMLDNPGPLASGAVVTLSGGAIP